MRADAPRPALSPRRREVLELLMQGCSSSQIAERLVISVHTADAHTAALLRHFGYHAKWEMVCAIWAERLARAERYVELARVAAESRDVGAGHAA